MLQLTKYQEARKKKSSSIMLMSYITHKPGQQPAWETGEIGHLISALAEMPEKGGPREAASPPAPVSASEKQLTEAS